MANNKYYKSIALLASGSIVGQIIGFVGSIFMTRLYSKADIGIMTTIISVTGMFAPVINGKYDFAIVKEQDEQKVYALAKLSCIIGLIFSVLVSAGSFVYFTGLEASFSPYLAVLFVLLILIITTFSNVFRSYNNHVADYKTMTSVIVFRRAAEEISMIAMGFAGFGSIGLLISRVVGQFFGVSRQIKNIKSKFKEILHSNHLREVGYEHKRQLLFSSPASLMNAASYSLISLVIGRLYGLDNLGVYSISFAVLGLPLSVISTNVSKVYFGEASKEYSSQGNFVSCTNKTVKLLALLAVALFFVMFFGFPYIVPFIYGKAYVDSGTIIRILTPMFVARFMTSSLNTGLVVANKQNVELYLQVFFIVAITICGMICSSLSCPYMTFLSMISISYCAIYIVNFFAIIYYSRPRLS